MKTILILAFLGISLLTVATEASDYSCIGRVGNSEISVSLNQESLYFYSPEDSADSQGKYLGPEEAPFSPWFNYQIYQLTDFYKTASASFKVALSPALALGEKSGDLFLYFDNETHEEEVQSFICVKKTN